MSLFRVYVDDDLFYHPGLSKLAITQAQVKEDAENIDSLTLAAPHNHPYISNVKPMSSKIVCKKGDRVVFEGRALNDGSDFYNTHHAVFSISFLKILKILFFLLFMHCWDTPSLSA